MLDTVLYRPGSSTKNRGLFDALERGFKCTVLGMEVGRYVSARRHIVAGLQFGALERMQAIFKSGEPYIFIDRAYFGGGPGSGRFRLVPHAYQHHWVDEANVDPARFQSFGVELKPWRAEGRHILLVPPGAAICRLFGLGDWEANTLARIRRSTNRPVRMSYKGDPEPLAARLRDCHAVVTWTSNVAVEAICAGVPAIVSRRSAARPVCGGVDHLEANIETPPMPQRDAWAAALAWGQFSLAEIASGFAAERVLRMPPKEAAA